MSSHVKKDNIIEMDNVVVRFVGDSGDGMQLTGSLFSDSSAFVGNDFATYPDYPAEIRAPKGTVEGVSGFQIQFGRTSVRTPGDFADVLVAMNPAALKSNLHWVKPDAIIIIDLDAFFEKNIQKAGYEVNPLTDNTLSNYHIIKAPISTMTKNAVLHLGLDEKVAMKSKNMFALGIVLYLFNRELKKTNEFFEEKFKSNPVMIEANKNVLMAGYNFADNTEEIAKVYNVEPAALDKGKYRYITGNTALAWGFLAAAEKTNLELFLGSYPITPASEILQELTSHKAFSVKAFQAEDEIAGICSSIGASYTGALAITTTSGPGLSLKSEAIGLAVMTELPIVIVDVQRCGPSTGLPTKSEQSDLMQALYGRNGEAPVIVIAAESSVDCFYAAYESAKLSIEHMTPVILLSDASLANGSEVFKIPKVADLKDIKAPFAKANDTEYKPYLRDEEKLNRFWAIPGTEGLRHRVGGLEKNSPFGNVSTDPLNHQYMVKMREKKVQRTQNFIPEQRIIGDDKGDLLVVSWGGTYGVMLTAVEKLQEQGEKISLAHFRYINPLPKNVFDVLKGFKKILVCEINNGQFVKHLRMNYPEFQYEQFNKIQGRPFLVSELKEKFVSILNEL